MDNENMGPLPTEIGESVDRKNLLSLARLVQEFRRVQAQANCGDKTAANKAKQIGGLLDRRCLEIMDSQQERLF
jgi:hypothetical protein